MITGCLRSRRKAAHILNKVQDNLGLGVMAEKWCGDNSEQWDNQGSDTVIALRSQIVIAIILIGEGTRHYLTIPDWYGLIRNEHLYDFDPAVYGLVCNCSADLMTGQKYPDSEGYVDFGEPHNMEMPAQQMIRRTYAPVPTVTL